MRLWDERETFFNAIESLPQTICHNDAFRRNLFAGRSADGLIQTIAIDWTYLGWGAVGEEIASLVVGTLSFNEVDWSQAVELSETAVEMYLDGLRDAGWRGDPRTVRLGFTAGVAMKYSFPFGISQFFSEAGRAWLEEAGFGDEDWLARCRFTSVLADEARVLMDELGLSNP